MNHARSFRDLHRPDHVLVLPNAWDAATARIFEDAGAEAIATTSAGFAWANGYQDGRVPPKRVLLDGVSAIARVTTIPLTVDMEAGYSDDPAEVADLISALLSAARVDGINIEDGDRGPELLEAKLRAIRRATDRAGADLFLNARSDVYLLSLAAPEDALRITIERAARYLAAGCDGFFVPGLSDPAAIAAIVHATELPVNALASPSLPQVEELRTIGVRRLSVGPGLALRAYGTAKQIAAEIVQRGSTAGLFAPNDMTYGTLNDLMSPRRPD
jgi:2-methylisocitrate lyase-like PEP mutase family enzyme